MCALLVGLPDVTVLAVDDRPGQPVRVHLEQRVDRRCADCGAAAWVKDVRSSSWSIWGASGARPG
jgi:hypothetical protein